MRALTKPQALASKSLGQKLNLLNALTKLNRICVRGMHHRGNAYATHLESRNHPKKKNPQSRPTYSIADDYTDSAH